jgi:hypothetical protein
MKYPAIFAALVALLAFCLQAADTTNISIAETSAIATNAPRNFSTFDERLSQIMSNAPADSKLYKSLSRIRGSATNTAPDRLVSPPFAEKQVQQIQPLSPRAQLMPPLAPPSSSGSNAIASNAELQVKVQALQEWRERQEQQTNGAPHLPP